MSGPVFAIVGATAVGKSEVGVAVAETLGGEIVSVDSMQVYRGLDAGTAKPSPALRARVPHHLLDEVEPDHDLTVAEFQQRARAAIRQIHERGRPALLVGGSGLYFRAVVDDLRFPPSAPEVRAALEEELEVEGAERLHARLTEVDPDAAARIEPTNERRIVRALEVIAITGRPFSENDTWTTYRSVYDLTVAGLQLSRETLFERIAARVDEMLAAGLEVEARSLAKAGLSRSARQALGYRQVLDAPEETPVDALRDEIVRATKRFARRQESWFRADPRVEWFDASAPALVSELVERFRATP